MNNMRMVFCLLITLFPTLVFGQDIEATTKDGKTVILKRDGTWEYKVNKPIQPEKQPNGSTVPGTGKVTNNITAFDPKLPFDDLDAAKIPFMFKGHDMPDLCNILGKSFEGKSEFETTDNYKKRIEKASKTPLYENLPIDSLLAFPKGTDYFESGSDGVKSALNYDADKGSMRIKITTESFLNEFNPSIKADSYCNLVFNNLMTYFTVTLRSKEISIDFNIGAEDARDLKENLHYLYLFRLKPPAASTLSINAELSELWFYSWRTGKVHYKLKFNTLNK